MSKWIFFRGVMRENTLGEINLFPQYDCITNFYRIIFAIRAFELKQLKMQNSDQNLFPEMLKRKSQF